jgi:hypothetical protein
MKNSLLIMLLFLCNAIVAQNKVLNPDFGAGVTAGIRSDGLGDIGGFYSPTGLTCGGGANNWCSAAYTSTPDYFRTAFATSYGVPSNGHGDIDSHTLSDSAYAGIITCKRLPNGYFQAEYLQGQLNSPLTVGKTYEVEFYVAKPATSTASTTIGCAFSSSFVDYNPTGAMHPLIDINNPIIRASTGLHLANHFSTSAPITSFSWTRVCFQFTPSEVGLNKILIGNFLDSTQCKVGVCSEIRVGYYFIDDVSVRELPDPSATLPVSIRICSGETVTLDGGTGYDTYQWYRNGVLIPGATSQLYTTSTVGGYGVVRQYMVCGALAVNIGVIATVENHSPLSASITHSLGRDTICCGVNPSTLTATVTGGNTPYTYLWSTGATTSSITISPTTSSLYTVTVTDQCNQTLVLSKRISASCPSLAFTPPVVYTCKAGTFKFPYTLTGGVGPYTWSPSDPNPAVGPGRSVSLSSSFLYTVRDAYSCTASASVSVNITKPTVTITSTVRDCSFLLTANVTGGSSSYTYLWSNGDVNRFTSVTLSGTYSVTVTDVTGCTATKSITITNNIKPVKFTLNCPTTSLCEGDSWTFTPAITLPFVGPVYAWSTGATTSTLSVTPPLGISTYTLTVTNPQTGCREVQTCTLSVVKCCRGVTNFNASIGCDSVQFTNTSTLYTSSANYKWTLGDGTEYIGLTPPAHFYAEGGYTVCLIVADGDCADTLCKRIIVNRECKRCCIADFDFAGCADEISFINNSHASDPSTVEYLWDFADGFQSSLKNPRHTFVLADPNVAQVFTVCLNIKDQSGCTKTICKDVLVKPCCPIVRDSCCSADSDFSFEMADCWFANFYNRSEVCVPPGGSVEYTWSFGDASIPNFVGFEPPINTIRYPADGIYYVSLDVRIFDQYGNTCTKDNYGAELFISCACFSNAKYLADQVGSSEDIFITDLSSFTATRPGGIPPVVTYDWLLDGSLYTPSSLPPYSGTNPGFLMSGFPDGDHFLKLILNVVTESGEICESEYCIQVAKDRGSIQITPIDCSYYPASSSERKSNETTPNEGKIELYPNPTNELLFIKDQTQSIKQIVILDELGRKVFEKKKCHESIYQINTKEYTNGVYFISIQNENGVLIKNQKIIIKH